jgi:hypothetical protein
VIVSATEEANIEYSGRIKSLDPETRTGVAIVGAKSAGRKIFGQVLRICFEHTCDGYYPVGGDRGMSEKLQPAPNETAERTQPTGSRVTSR